MAIEPISTRSIDLIKNSKSKLRGFRATESLKDACSTHEEYIQALSLSVFTLMKNTSDKSKYKYISALIERTPADLSYLIQNLVELDNPYFDIVSVVDLYESLLRENWIAVKKERAILNSLKFDDKTANSNIAICESIIDFLKECVLDKGAKYDNII